jgi:FSR family fosmidomycin resistance protein-like MFS transporter
LRISSRMAVLLLAFGHLFNDFYCNFLPVLLPIIMPKLDLSLTLAGVLVMVMSITSNLLQPVFGFFMDRHRMSWLLIPVIPFGALCITGIGYIHTKYLLFLAIALTGLSVSAFHPLGSSLVSRVARMGKQGVSMSLYVAGGNIGYAIAPFIIVAFTQSYSLESLPWLMIPSLIMLILFAYSGISRLTTVQALPQNTSQPLSLRKMLLCPSILWLNIAMALRCWVHVATSTFLPLLLISYGISQMTAGSLLTFFLVGCAAGGLIGGSLGDRLGHKKIILSALMLSVLPTLYFFLHPALTISSLLALFLSGACLLASQPSSIVWAQKAMPGNAGMASGMMMGMSFGVGAFGTMLTAFLADHIGLQVAMVLTCIPLALSVLAAWIAPYPETSKSHN